METVKRPRKYRRIGTTLLASVLLTMLVFASVERVYAITPTFSPIINLSNTAANSNGQQVAVSGSNVYVVWRDNNEILFRASNNNGATFGPTINLSNNVGVSQNAQIAAAGNNVYVLWQDDTPGNFDIFFRASNDNGANFGSVINLSSDSGRSGGLLGHLAIAAAGSNVYAAWQDDDQGLTNFDILFRASNNNGASFDSAINLSNNTGNSQSPDMAALGSDVYVVWRDSTPGNFDILFRASNNNGASFDSAINLSNNTGNSQSPDMAALGSDVYVVWRDSTPGNFDILFRASNNNGASFDSAINLSNNAGSSQTPQVAAAGNNAYVVWRDDTPGNFDILFRASNNNGASFDSAINLSNNAGSSQTPDIEAVGADVFVAWSDNTTGNIEVLFRPSNDDGSSFGSTANLSNNAGSSQTPDVNTSTTDVFVAWFDSTPGNNEIFFRASDDAPVANGQNVETNEDNALVITLTGSDVEGDALTFSIVSGPTNGVLGAITPIDPTSASVTYTPNLNFFGADSFTFRVNDGTLDSNIATVNITVNSVNDDPVANNDSVSTNEDTVLDNIAVLANDTDADGDTLNITSFTQPTNGTVEAGTLANTLRYIPNANFNGVDTFTYTVSDGNGGTDTATVSVTVSAVNDAPVTNDQSVTTGEDTPVPITLTASDVEGDALTFSIVSGPTNGVLSGAAPNVTYTPNPDYNGADSFTFKANDGSLDSNVATVSITVSAVNDAPVANDQSVTTGEDTPVPITLTASDVEGDALTFSIVSGPTNGVLSG
ncbi:MAG: Ig-like domain-containing protein, partial [Nitrososphaerales archaeon]